MSFRDDVDAMVDGILCERMGTGEVWNIPRWVLDAYPPPTAEEEARNAAIWAELQAPDAGGTK